MNITGLDLSLTATGIACAEHFDLLKPPKGCVGMERLRWIREAVMSHGLADLALPSPDLVVIEGYAMGTHRQAGTYAIGELGGIIRYTLWSAGVTYVEVAPASLKRFATGRGNANKAEMMAAAYRCNYDGPADDNAIDSWWLRMMGLYATTHGTGAIDLMGALEDSLTPPEGIARTKYRAEAVAKVAWPEGVGA